MAGVFGATPDDWRRWQALGLTEDLLPVVSNPNAEISGDSTMRQLGKTPSRYNQDRRVVGIAKWTEKVTTAQAVQGWLTESDYGIAIQTRRLRAIDVDVEDRLAAERIAVVLAGALGHNLTVRWREGSGKFLVPFWMEDELYKHVVPVTGGMVEILGTGQQFIAEGMHTSGSRYQWVEGEIPELDAISFAVLLERLKAVAVGEIRIARKRRAPPGARETAADPVAAWLWDNWECYDEGTSGQIFIECPFAAEHSTDTGPSSTAYFPAGSGGYAEGAFVCLHAHCTGRGQAEFLNATGFVAGGFDSLPTFAEGIVSLPAAACDRSGIEPGSRTAAMGAGADFETLQSADRSARRALIARERWPTLKRDAAGRIEATMSNLLAACSTPHLIGHHLALDRFRDVIMCAKAEEPRLLAEWRPFRDSDYAWVQSQLENRGFKAVGKESLRMAVLTVAEEHGFDTAREWLDRIQWDGVPRLEQFCVRGWGWADTPYSRAVGRYVWTALAGRIVEPGCQADMAPILVGAQGKRKTSAIMAMVPDGEFYTEIKLNDRDDDLARKMRGVLVAEIEELRGLNSRGIDEIKSFITRRAEKWVPKFREFATAYKRRLLFFGSTNEFEFLADPTGERRWLPGECGRLDVEWIRDNREQLWAEGAALFKVDGVDWQDAERLAKAEHDRFKVGDLWDEVIARWLREGSVSSFGGPPVEEPHLYMHDVLAGALNISPSQADRGKEIRAGKCMSRLGFMRVRLAADESGHRPWAYVREEADT